MIYKTILRDFRDSEALYKTITIMNRLEKESLQDENFLNFVAKTFSAKDDDILTIYKVHNWIYDNIVYVDDEYDETIVSPRVMIGLRQGDCDDFALLTKTVLKAKGIETRYLLLGKQKGIFSHIAVVYKVGNVYIYIDSTLKKLGLIPKVYINLKII